jgi:hypothetical protein
VHQQRAVMAGTVVDGLCEGFPHLDRAAIADALQLMEGDGDRTRQYLTMTSPPMMTHNAASVDARAQQAARDEGDDDDDDNVEAAPAPDARVDALCSQFPHIDRTRVADALRVLNGDVDRARQFLAVTAAPAGSGVFENQDDDDEATCPICMDEKDDIEQIEHLPGTIGDVSSHRMCGACRASYGVEECPFCREVTIVTQLDDFVQNIEDQLKRGAGDQNAFASIFETWEMFEMQYAGRSQVVRRVACTVITDAGFAARIVRATAGKAKWLRDMCGVIFRLHALAHDDEALQSAAPPVAAASLTMLDAAVDAILGHFHDNKVDMPHLGAMYGQSLAALLTSAHSGMATGTMVQTVRRAAAVCVKHSVSANDAQEFRGHMPAMYVQAAQGILWPRSQDDVVHNKFFKKK